MGLSEEEAMARHGEEHVEVIWDPQKKGLPQRDTCVLLMPLDTPSPAGQQGYWLPCF